MLQHAHWANVVSPVSHGMFDWMHILLVGGVFNLHAALLLVVLKEAGYTQAVLHSWIQKWVMPKRMQTGNSAADIMDERRHANHLKECTLKATASECLTFMCLFASFLEGTLGAGLGDAFNTQVACFLQLVQIIELIVRSAKHHTDVEALKKCIGNYLAHFSELFGSAVMTPKFHFLMHIPAVIEKFGWAPSCFCLERKHRTAKQFGNNCIMISETFDKSTLREVTSHHIVEMLKDSYFVVTPGLVDPVAPKPGFKKSLQRLCNLDDSVEVLSYILYTTSTCTLYSVCNTRCDTCLV